MLRRNLNAPTVIAIAALVFAMVGGAVAATGSGGGKAEASAGERGPRGPKGPRGARGPVGPVGAQGPAGAPGAPGAKGDTGPAGVDGEDGVDGVDGQDGQDGQTGFTEVLPDGKTETGIWYVLANQNEATFASLSFNIPLPDAPDPVLVEQGENGTAEGCPGLVGGTPAADPGKLCVYIHSEQGTLFTEPDGDPPLPEAFAFADPTIQSSAEAPQATTPSGALIQTTFCVTGSCAVYGTWAVTAANTP